MAWQVNFFQTPRGDYPVKDFIENRDKSTQARITQSIGLLIDYGSFLKPPDIKKLKDKLYELRIRGTVTIRIFYTINDGKYYLLHAFIKKSQKTPTKEIKIALDRIKNII